MKQHALNWARRMVACMFCSVIAVSLLAVPARREWRTVTQADGTSIEVQHIGDEFYHYFVTRDGKIAEMQEDGSFVVTNRPQPTGEQITALRKASKRYVNRAKKVGASSMPARGLFILVSFSDKSFGSSSEAYYKSSLGDATEGAKSMYNYLKLQSNGKYAPPIDVYGPVTLSKQTSYYGSNDSQGYDQHAAEMVVEACKALDSEIDFSKYDANSDGTVDNVYIIYAGKGEADGGAASTIWPHQWSIDGEGLSCKLDGKNIYTYACSAELNGRSQYAMGTPLHEFSHVLGLPDYYDTQYESTNYTEGRTPNEWSLMDQGSYNDDGQTPPNYSIFDKYYLGWDTPKLLAKDAQESVTLTTEYGDAYQLNGGTTLLAATNTQTIYYVENRQQTGWDAALPGHGMIVWRVMYSKNAWEGNSLNDVEGTTRYTVLSATGNQTYIGKDTDPFPGKDKVTSWTPFTGCEFTEISESNGKITFKFNGGEPVDPFDLTWMADGQLWATTSSTGKVTFPNTPEGCANGKEFVGWTATKDYESATTAPTFVQAGDAVEQATTYYAVYATKGEGGEATFDGNTGGTFKIYAQAGNTKYYATGTVDNSKLQSSMNEAEAAEFTFAKVDGGFTIKTGNKYLSNGSKTNVSLSSDAYTWSVENGTHGTWRLNSSTNANRALVFRAGDYNVYGAYSTSNINGTEYFDLEIGGGSGASYTDYSTVCGSVEPCVLTGITLNTDNVKKTFLTGDAFNADGLVVTAEYSNCNSKTVTPTSVSTPDMTVAGERTVTVSYTEEEVTKTAEYKITVNEPAMFTIRFYDNGEQIGEDQVVVEGQQPKVPASPTPVCRMFTFVGWWTAELAEDNTEAKAWITDFTATKDQDYYAIFSKTVEGEGGATAFDGNTGGNFKIYSQDGETKYYAKNTINSSNKLESTTTEAEAAEFTFAKVEGGFTIQTGEKYLSYGGSGTNVSLKADAYVWEISASTAGVGSWRAIASTANTRALALRVASNFQSFGAYATSNIKANSEYFDIEIEGGASSTTYYSSTEICNPTAVEQVVAQPSAIKAIRDGQMVIIRGNEVYSITGLKIE